MAANLAFGQLKNNQIQCGAPGFLDMAGSSTLAPLAVAWNFYYQTLCPGMSSNVGGNGSAAGAGRVCADPSQPRGPVIIANMSRPWKSSEGRLVGLAASNTAMRPFIYQCMEGDPSRSVAQIAVANDGITFFAGKNSPAASCIAAIGGLNKDVLRWMYSSYSDEQLKQRGWNSSVLKNSDNNSNTHLWSELDPSCPAVEIQPAGLGPSSGTYDYFKVFVLTDNSNGETFRSNKKSSAEQNEIVSYVTSNPASVGFIGYTYDVQRVGQIYTAPLDGIVPSIDAIADGSYPAVRKLYMNLLIDPAALPITVPYMEAALRDGDDLTRAMGFVPLNAQDKAEMFRRLADIY